MAKCDYVAVVASSNRFDPNRLNPAVELCRKVFSAKTNENVDSITIRFDGDRGMKLIVYVPHVTRKVAENMVASLTLNLMPARAIVVTRRQAEKEWKYSFPRGMHKRVWVDEKDIIHLLA